MLCAVWDRWHRHQNRHDAAAVVDTVAELIKRRQNGPDGMFSQSSASYARIIAGIKTPLSEDKDNTFLPAQVPYQIDINFIKHRTINPTIVVRLLAKMEFNASLIALLNAVI